MAEFDLIPADYRYWQWQLACIKRAAALTFIGVSFILMATAYLHAASTSQNTLLIDLQRQLAMTNIRQEQLSRLAENEQTLQAHWQLLQGLRGGVRVESALAIIDEALARDDVWFLNLRFQRVVQKVAADTAPGTDSYIVDLRNHLAGDQGESWSLDTQISITGQAKNHSAFSEFVQRLSSSSEVHAVSIARTSLTTVNDTAIVEFSIQVSMNNNLVSNDG